MTPFLDPLDRQKVREVIELLEREGDLLLALDLEDLLKRRKGSERAAEPQEDDEVA